MAVLTLRCACGNLFSRSWQLSYSLGLSKYNILHKLIGSGFCTASKLEDKNRRSSTRKKRDKFTVIKALASTVNVVHNKPDYRFYDDPILLPRTLRKQKEALMAIQSGEDAANQVIEDFSHLFPFRVPEPKWPEPEILRSKNVADKEVSVENLRKLMKSGENQMSMVVNWYKTLSSEGDLPLDVHNDMLDYASFHAIPGDVLMQEKTVKLEVSASEWSNDNFAEKLFSNLKNQGNMNGRTYEVFILGLLKYGQIPKAFEIYAELAEKKLHGSLFMYNTLLEYVTQSADSDDKRWDLAQTIVSGMRDGNVKPNVVTFNVLMAIAAEKVHGAGILCLHLVREMKKLGISPSLGTYHYLLRADKQEDVMEVNLLTSILKDLRSGVVEFVLQHPSDLLFFHSAMDLARYKRRRDLAIQIFDIVKTNKIEHLITQVSSFYGNYLSTIARHSNIDELFAEYRRLVPAFFIPRAWMLEQLFYAFKHHKDPKYVPELFSDMITLRIPLTPRGMQALFSAMAENIPEERAEEFLFVVTESEKWMDVYNVGMTRETQSEAIKIFCLCDKYEEVMRKVGQCKELKIVPSADAMFAVLELTIKHENKEDTLKILRKMAHYNMKITNAISELIDSHGFLSKRNEEIRAWFN